MNFRLRYSLIFLFGFFCSACLLNDTFAENPYQVDDHPNNSATPTAINLSNQQLLNRINQFLSDRQYQAAEYSLDQINPQQLSPEDRSQWLFFSMQTALQNRQPKSVLKFASQLLSMAQSIANPQLWQVYLFIAQAKLQLGQYSQMISLLQHAIDLLPKRQENNYFTLLNMIWQNLQRLTPDMLIHSIQSAPTPTIKGWFELALLTKKYNYDSQQLQQQLNQWMQNYPQHIALNLLPTEKNMQFALPHKIALLLPLKGDYQEEAQAIQNGFYAAYNNDPKYNIGNRPIISIIDTSQGNIHDLYESAVKQGVNLVIGPLTKDNIATLVQTTQLSVPTMALNTLSDLNHPVKNLYQFGLSPLDEAQQAAEKAWIDGHHQALIIAPDDDWGKKIGETFIAKWQKFGGVVVDQSYYGAKNTLIANIRNILHINQSEHDAKLLKLQLHEIIRSIPRRRKDIDMIFLVADHQTGQAIRPLLQYYFAGDVPVYAISTIFSGNVNAEEDNDLDGIYFCDMPWVLSPKQLLEPLQKLRENIQNSFPESFSQYPKLYALGIDAWHLSVALNQFGIFPFIGIPGATGLLYLNNQNHIYRQVMWSRIERGIPMVLNDAS